MSRWPIKSYLIALFWIPLAITLVSIGNRDNYCTRVIDGDTIVVTIGGQEEKVRLIGVDTPETVHPNKPVEYFGKEASEFTRRMVEGKQVSLEYDWQRKDKYGRTLAYVYLKDGP